MKTSVDAVIIGAGIIGCSIALALSKRGMKTLNVDRLPAAGYGSTSYSSAMIRTHYSSLESTALAYESFFHWNQWTEFLGVNDERGTAVFNQVGCLVLKPSEDQTIAKMLEYSDALGIPYQRLSANEIRGRWPFLDLTGYYPPKLPSHEEFGMPTGGELDGGVFFTSAGYINDPQLATHNFQIAAEAHGAEFCFNAGIIDIRKINGKVSGVTLADGREIDADVVINAAGPHSSKINQLAGVAEEMNLSTRAQRQEVAHLPSLPGLNIETEGTAIADEDTGAYLRPEIGNQMVIGGINPECDPDDWVDPDDFYESLTDQAVNQVMRLAQRVPEMGIPSNLSGVVACYDVADDWIPIYDRSNLNGFYMAVGTSGNQFKNAPLVGEMMADLIFACEKGQDHDENPVVFHLQRLDMPLNLGFFSRNRNINQDSSFSVLG